MRKDLQGETVRRRTAVLSGIGVVQKLSHVSRGSVIMSLVKRVHYHGKVNTSSRLYRKNLETTSITKIASNPSSQKTEYLSVFCIRRPPGCYSTNQPAKTRTSDLIAKSTAKHNCKANPPKPQRRYKEFVATRSTTVVNWTPKFLREKTIIN